MFPSSFDNRSIYRTTNSNNNTLYRIHVNALLTVLQSKESARDSLLYEREREYVFFISYFAMLLFPRNMKCFPLLTMAFRFSFFFISIDCGIEYILWKTYKIECRLLQNIGKTAIKSTLVWDKSKKKIAI